MTQTLKSSKEEVFNGSLEGVTWRDENKYPMHGIYQELGNIITALHCHLWDYDEKYNDIEQFLMNCKNNLTNI